MTDSNGDWEDGAEMKVRSAFIRVAICLAGMASAGAQTPLPVLGNIEAPYASIQSSVRIAGVTWGAGSVSYGPVGTPLVLSGSGFGGSGTV